MTSKITVGSTVGRWQVTSKIGRGGNGVVFACSDVTSVVAMKVLSSVRPIAYQRFKDEVETLQRIANIQGILPVIESYLPADLADGQPWYVMPLGKTIEEWGITASPIKKVIAISQVARTMAELHSRGIAHRDIKPGNLIVHGNRCCPADFGLVIYPGKLAVTDTQERIGPFWMMAPEVRRQKASADPFPGDVYALAKTLWSVLHGAKYAFDGQYSNGQDFGISRFFPGTHCTPLEQLLARSTDSRVDERPTMSGFYEELNLWLKTYDDFVISNPIQWQEALGKIFPTGLPAVVEWRSAEQIVRVLDILGVSNLNHMFYPSGGGNDLAGARLSEHESGCIEIKASSWSLLKPKRLIFHGFEHGTEWSYFRLEADELDPCGIYEETPEYARNREEVTRINNTTYADRGSWDNNWFDGAKLPDDAHHITRWFEGSFVIFQKTSFYNLVGGKLDAYNGQHNKMTDGQFLSLITEMKRNAEEKEIDLRTSRYAHRKPKAIPSEL